MKKVVFVAICIVSLMCFSSCRSTSKPCGLADTITTNQTTLKQINIL
ncbi:MULTISPECIES: hypothetical protein [Polaribacter]|uniref:Uncharacterized protein n=1 Tax=Polaribacter marinaquae TaxID=1642819 RepID=A0ABZ2TT56_9FLAO|nr:MULTISPECIES: hypothetical protein [unclassified Polaribacter]SHN07189.1 hypothetical protein SAMN05720268_2662 [Polaribacter sp. KT 15]